MEPHYDQILDSPSKNSYIGSYYQPPDRVLPMPRQLELPAHSSISKEPQLNSSCVSQNKSHVDSKAVVDALKTLQHKIRRLEGERMQAQKSYQQISQNVQPAASQPETENCSRKELDSKLQSAEARCKILEKQLDYMKKMVESVKKERIILTENQCSLQNQQPCSSNAKSQQEKLEELESDNLKLTRTLALAETKLKNLERNLQKEEHERQIVQEKADKLLEELDTSRHPPMLTTTEEIMPRKKTKKTTKKSESELRSPISLRHKKIPFVAGTSTSPSHSVHANVQSILHMMKHHQPQLCKRIGTLNRSENRIRKNLQKAFPPSSSSPHERDTEIEQKHQPLGSLSDLLLALQDELGQMSFEHQELVGQIDATQQSKQRQDLQRELERLVTRMEEKGAQITKLRKHQQTVQKLTQGQPCSEEPTAKKLNGIKPPVPSPVKAKQTGNKGGTSLNNLQLLRETQKFRNRLKQDDLSWET